MEKILVSAGEESGDLYASLLVKEIRKQNKNVKIIAFGGYLVKEAGADLKINLLKISVIGFWEVVLKIFDIIRIMIKSCGIIKQEKPDMIVVIDFPGFHLWLIKKARQLGVKKIIYWMTPQVWAWKYDRIKIIKKYCDLCVVAFPFEKKIFEKERIPAKYFGHPVVEIIKNYVTKSTGYKIGIFPGSRKNEVSLFLPIILRACLLIKENIPETDFILFKSKTLDIEFINKIMAKFGNLDIKITRGDDFKTRRLLAVAIVKSGTITLENALFGIPMVVVYKLSFLSYLITKKLIRTKFVSLPNIIAGKRIITELIQNDFTPENICREITDILKDKKKKDLIKNEYKKIRKSIYLKNTIKNTAKAILGEI